MTTVTLIVVLLFTVPAALMCVGCIVDVILEGWRGQDTAQGGHR